MYLRDPHVVLAMAPQELFLDPRTPTGCGSSITAPARSSRAASASAGC
jgi:hypothetical protein